MITANPVCGDCSVRHRALCDSLSDTELAGLRSIARHRRLGRGDVLCWSGDESSICANVTSGVLKISGSTGDGREQIVGLLYPSEFVGHPYQGAVEFTVTAATEVTLCVFPRAGFEPLLTGHSRMAQQLLRRTLAALDQARARTVMLGRMSASDRISAFLIEMAEHSSNAGWRHRTGRAITFDLPLSRGEMADVLGLTIETVSRNMTKLRLAGLIELPGGRAVTIVEAVTLASMVTAA